MKGKWVLWQTLKRLAGTEPGLAETGYDELTECADQQLSDLERHRLEDVLPPAFAARCALRSPAGPVRGRRRPRLRRPGRPLAALLRPAGERRPPVTRPITAAGPRRPAPARRDARAGHRRDPPGPGHAQALLPPIVLAAVLAAVLTAVVFVERVVVRPAG